MPTATTTTIKRTTASSPSALLLKSMSSVDPKALRSSYHRAARAFLNHDIPLTHSLLESAFSSLENSPSVLPSSSLRKWDILRITFETTVYSTCHSGTVPESLKDLTVKSPQVFVTDMHRRSLEMFGKSNGESVDVVLLPAPVLSTLVYSSLKVECAEIGRMMIEQWLARRGGRSFVDEDGYAKIFELYCLQVLPKLEEWEYAAAMLEYEIELGVQDRENLKISLQNMHSQALAARLPSSSSSSSSLTLPSISRTQSPTPSSSGSSSSSLSTKSTHTIVPSSPRPSAPSSDSEGTVTPRASARSKSNSRSRSVQRSTGVNGSQGSSPHRITHAHHPLNPNSLTPLSLPRSYTSAPVQRPASPSTYALIKASLAPYFTLGSTTNKITTFFLLLVVVPALSLLLRIRRKRRRLALAGAGADLMSADIVRQRLREAGAGQFGFLTRAWSEVVRAVIDTVKMGGSGLV